jgi:DNA replication protein DnaC
MNEELKTRLSRIMASRPPRLPGKRSAALTRQLMAISEGQRTFLQARMLSASEQGDCIGCNQLGEPLSIEGWALPVTLESNGFAAPAEFCDCADGVSFQKRIQRQRREFIQQDMRMRRTYAQRLFGPAFMTHPSLQERNLKTWPQAFDHPEGVDEFDYIGSLQERNFIAGLVRDYTENLSFKYIKSKESQRGLCLIGGPGVGKTGLISCVEPLIAQKGHFMLSLYVPELLRLIKNSEQAENMLKVMRTAEVLFLDDLGNPLFADPISPEVYSLFVCIFDARLKHNRPTFITTNLDEDTLEEQFGTYILSRIQTLCHMFILPGIDLR